MKRRFEVLDAWRGIAAVMVALYHFSVSSHFREFGAVANASLFVDFFFVLSGFVLTHAYAGSLRSNMKFRDYFLRRLARLWPLHLAVIGYLLAAELYTAWQIHNGIISPVPVFDGSLGRGVTTLFQNVFLLQTIWPDVRVGWNGPSWSISAEFWTCLIFGAMACAMTKRALLVASAAVVALSALAIWQFSPVYMGTFLRFALLQCVVCFFAGHLVYRAAANTNLRFGAATVAEIASIGVMGWFLTVANVEVSGPVTMLAPIIFAAMVWSFSYEAGAISKVLRTRPFLLVGTFSYSIYLVHETVAASIADRARTCLAAPDVLGCAPYNWLSGFFTDKVYYFDALTIAFLLIVVAIAAATYRLIENPGRNLFRKRARHSKSATAALGRRPGAD